MKKEKKTEEELIAEKYELNFLRKQFDKQDLIEKLLKKHKITGATDEAKAQIISEKIIENDTAIKEQSTETIEE